MNENVAGIDQLLSEAKRRGIVLWLDAGELRCRGTEDALDGALLAQLRARRDDIIASLRQASLPRTPALPSFQREQVPDDLPIIDYHRPRWANIRSGALGPEFVNLPHVAGRFKGKIDLHLLHKSLHHLRTRHSILAARVVDRDDGPRLVFEHSRKLEIEHVDLKQLAAAERELTAVATAGTLTWRAFAEDEPWLRVFVITLSESDHLIGIVVHHFIADGWSISILTRELLSTYAAFARGEHPQLKPLPLQYSDYVIGINRWLQSGGAEESARYWRQCLKGAPATRLIPDREADLGTYGESATATFHVPREVAAGIRELSKTGPFFVHAIVLAAIAIAIAWQSDSTDIVIVTRTSGRFFPEILGLVGAFFDAMAIRALVRMEEPFRSVVDQVQETMVRSYPHQHYPYQLVKSSLGDVGASDLAPWLNYVDLEEDAPANATAERRPHCSALAPVQLPPPPQQMHPVARYATFSMQMTFSEGELRGSIDYHLALFERETMARFVETLCRVLSTGSAQSSIPIRALLAR